MGWQEQNSVRRRIILNDTQFSLGPFQILDESLGVEVTNLNKKSKEVLDFVQEIK